LYKLGNVWIQSHGLDHVNLEIVIPYLAGLGCGRIWLDSASAPRLANMRRVQRTYERAAVVFGILNRADSAHFWRVRDAVCVLQQTLAQLLPRPEALPTAYLAGQPLSPPSRDYYKNVHTY
jgi:hypothetical protein